MSHLIPGTGIGCGLLPVMERRPGRAWTPGPQPRFRKAHPGPWSRAACILATIVLLGGCATMRTEAPLAPVAAESVTLSSAEIVERVFNPAQQEETAAAGATEAPSEAVALTLDEIQSIAREKNPTFAEYAASREAAKAEVLQALAYPNPDIETDLELVLSIFQPIELPGKRKARREAAEASLPVVERDEDLFRAKLTAETAKAYAAILFYERALTLARESLKTEQEIEAIVARRVDAGETAEIDRIKAQVETLKASRAVQAQQRLCNSARAVLNALCGQGLPPVYTLEDTLEAPLARADMTEARKIAMEQHPALQRLDALVRQKGLVIRREETAWYPDLRLGVPVGMELPLANRNEGGIAMANADLQKIQAELTRTTQEIQRDLETGAQAYEGALEQLAVFQNGLRAAAAEALSIETFLYQEGEADLLQLLDARRTARQTETEYLQALYDARIARIELEQAIGIGGDKK